MRSRRGARSSPATKQPHSSCINCPRPGPRICARRRDRTTRPGARHVPPRPPGIPPSRLIFGPTAPSTPPCGVNRAATRRRRRIFRTASSGSGRRRDSRPASLAFPSPTLVIVPNQPTPHRRTHRPGRPSHHVPRRRKTTFRRARRSAPTRRAPGHDYQDRVSDHRWRPVPAAERFPLSLLRQYNRGRGARRLLRARTRGRGKVSRTRPIARRAALASSRGRAHRLTDRISNRGPGQASHPQPDPRTRALRHRGQAHRRDPTASRRGPVVHRRNRRGRLPTATPRLPRQPGRRGWAGRASPRGARARSRSSSSPVWP